MTEADKVLEEVEGMTRKRFLPIIGRQKGQVLVDVVRQVRPKRVLEVGTLIGYSAVLIGRELEKDAELTTIEIHEDEGEEARRNIKRANIPPTVRVLVGDAIQILPKLNGQFDLVFIDAEKSEYLDYLRLIEDKLHKGTVIVVDNAGIFADEMRNYLNYVRSSKKYSSKYISVGDDGVEVSERLN